jgi:hypothetical protein
VDTGVAVAPAGGEAVAALAGGGEAVFVGKTKGPVGGGNPTRA